MKNLIEIFKTVSITGVIMFFYLLNSVHADFKNNFRADMVAGGALEDMTRGVPLYKKIILQTIGRRIDKDAEFHLIKEGNGAFSLANGFIVMSENMYDELDSPENVAAVLAHEVAHYRMHHLEKLQNRMDKDSLGIAMKIISLSGYLASMLHQNPEMGKAFIDVGNGIASSNLNKTIRSLEAEADIIGLNYLLSSGYSVFAMKNVLKNMSAMETEKYNIGSHDLFSIRLDRINRKMRSMKSRNYRESERFYGDEKTPFMEGLDSEYAQKLARKEFNKAFSGNPAPFFWALAEDEELDLFNNRDSLTKALKSIILSVGLESSGKMYHPELLSASSVKRVMIKSSSLIGRNFKDDPLANLFYVVRLMTLMRKTDDLNDVRMRQKMGIIRHKINYPLVKKIIGEECEGVLDGILKMYKEASRSGISVN